MMLVTNTARRGLQPFDSLALADWLVDACAHCIKERVAAGDSAQEAEANASRSFEQLVLRGSPAPGEFTGRARVGDQEVGSFVVRIGRCRPEAMVGLGNRHQRGPKGTRTWTASHAAGGARRPLRGATTIGLNVFGQNRVAPLSPCPSDTRTRRRKREAVARAALRESPNNSG